jgi:hypothetical protein
MSDAKKDQLPLAAQLTKGLVNPYVNAVTGKHQISLNLLVAVAFRYSSAFVSSSYSASP